jgi:hypothetical protein
MLVHGRSWVDLGSPRIESTGGRATERRHGRAGSSPRASAIGRESRDEGRGKTTRRSGITRCRRRITRRCRETSVPRRGISSRRRGIGFIRPATEEIAPGISRPRRPLEGPRPNQEIPRRFPEDTRRRTAGRGPGFEEPRRLPEQNRRRLDEPRRGIERPRPMTVDRDQVRVRIVRRRPRRDRLKVAWSGRPCTRCTAPNCRPAACRCDRSATSTRRPCWRSSRTRASCATAVRRRGIRSRRRSTRSSAAIAASRPANRCAWRFSGGTIAA